MKDLPKTIDNGHGERLTFRRLEQDHPEGATLIVANELQPSCGPPMHVHFQQEEGLTVEEGRLAVQVEGEPVKYYGPGESVVFPAGTPHKFWAEGEVTRCEGYVRPPHNFQYFISEIYRSTKESGQGRPDDVESALLLDRYGEEYDMLEIPSFVKKVVFPVLRTLGRLRGRHRRYDTGPAPLT